MKRVMVRYKVKADKAVENEENPLSQSSAFKSFQEDIKDRCEEPPVAVDLHTIGAYQFLE